MTLTELPGSAPERLSPARTFVAWMVAVIALLLILLPLVEILASVPANFQAASLGQAPETLGNDTLFVILVYSLVMQVAFPVTGLLLLGGFVPGVPTLPYFRTRVRALVSRWSPEPVAKGALHGLVLTPALLLYSIAAGLAAAAVMEAVTGVPTAEPNNPFKEVNLGIALGIALAAGIGEELLFRGVLQGALQRTIGLAGAVLIQGVLFGLVHGGYGSWVNPIVAGGFGLLAGLIAGRIGLVALMVAHTVYDVIAITAGVESLAPLAGGLVLLLLALTIGQAIYTRGALWRRILGLAPAMPDVPPPLPGFQGPFHPLTTPPPPRPPHAAALERAGYKVCPRCSRYPLLGGLSGGTWRCRVCWYEELASHPGPLQASHQEKLARVRVEHEAIVRAVVESEQQPPP